MSIISHFPTHSVPLTQNSSVPTMHGSSARLQARMRQVCYTFDGVNGGRGTRVLRSHLFLLHYDLFLTQTEGNGVLRNTNDQEALSYSFLLILLSHALVLHLLT